MREQQRRSWVVKEKSKAIETSEHFLYDSKKVRQSRVGLVEIKGAGPGRDLGAGGPRCEATAGIWCSLVDPRQVITDRFHSRE